MACRHVVTLYLQSEAVGRGKLLQEIDAGRKMIVKFGLCDYI